MSVESAPEEARKTLQRFASLPDVPNKVAGAEIIADRSEVAYIDDVERMVATESTTTETVPASTYRQMESDRVPFNSRHEAPNTPGSLTNTTVKAVEKGNNPDTCPDCDGQGTNECGDCSGSARLPCPNNCGDGRVRCPSCDGTLSVSCGNCSGNGQEACSKCGGDGRISCGNCDYNGKQSCPECSGGWSSGTVKCNTCGGSGTTGHGDSKQSCHDCNGNGERTCHRCNGDGKIACQDCGGAASHPCSNCSGGTTPCSSCDGSGTKACTRCSNGTVTCEKCSGESTVPCGCGNGRVDCDTCETEGKLVTAKTAVIEYSVEEETSIHSELVTDSDLLTRDHARSTETEEDVDVDQPVVDGSWVHSDVRDRHEIPLQYVEYTFRGDDYDVLQINEDLHSLSAPESEQLREVQRAVEEQRSELREEYDQRVEHLVGAVTDRRAELTDSFERRERIASIGKTVRYALALTAVIGLYLVV